MSDQIRLSDYASAVNEALDEARNDKTHEIRPDVAYRRLAIVNVAFVGRPDAGDRGWVLIDAGLYGTAALIRSAAAARFGEGARPAAIVLTHGHFDHVGVLEDLAEEWDAPVYAHELELPYLTGQASYPPGDPSVGGGAMATLSHLYPRKPIDLEGRVQPLPLDHAVPFMPGWEWIHTPGHSVGHVSLWRAEDRTLIAGDAVVTTDQESAYAVLVQKAEMHGPPMYYTVEWDKAKASVERLAALEPDVILTGHGEPMQGLEMRLALQRLAEHFGTIALPRTGRYLASPARAEDGSAYCTP